MIRRLLLTAVAVLAAAAGVAAQDLRIGGAVPRPIVLTPSDVAMLPHVTVDVVRNGTTTIYGGVLLLDVLRKAGVTIDQGDRTAELTEYVVVTGTDGYRAVFALADLDPDFTDHPLVLADKRDDKPLPANAVPYQVVAPADKRPTRWVRQVVAIELGAAPAAR